MEELPLHRKTRVWRNTQGSSHFLTFSITGRQPYLLREGAADAFLMALDDARHIHDFALRAYVVMPEHSHILIWPRSESYAIGTILSAIKRPSARAILGMHPDLREAVRYSRAGREDEFRLWMTGGGFDKNISSPRELSEVARYIHGNPVARGLCEGILDWPWTSARAYHEGTAPIPIDWDGVEL